MDMEYMDLHPRPYQGINMQQPFYGQMQTQPQSQQHHLHHHHEQPQGQQPYPYWNHHLVALYQQQQHQRAAMMLGQGGMHGSKQTEPKPRLAKDEVDLLEREFAKNPKPNSSTKRELAEQMGVEVPRINNWFQNRRAKEKQIKKTAEFEAQQARERANSEPSSSDDQEQGVSGEPYELNDHQQRFLSTAVFSEPEGSVDGSEGVESEQPQSVFDEPQTSDAGSMPLQRMDDSPSSSDSDGFVHIEFDESNSAMHAITGLTPAAVLSDAFSPMQTQGDFQTPGPYALDTAETQITHGLSTHNYDVLSSHAGAIHDHGMDTFTRRDYFAIPSVSHFPSQLITEGLPRHAHASPTHDEPREGSMDLGSASPCQMSVSPPADMRFKSPPPPSDIASRRNRGRLAPLGLTPLRGSPHAGPKTGIDVPRRSETASPMRRISSATGGRVHKSFANAGGPRSPFVMDRNKEALFQSLQNSQSPVMASLGNAMSPVSPDGANGQVLRENTTGTNASDDEQTYAFGSLSAVGGFPLCGVETSMKTPPDTPGLATNFPEHFFPSAVEQAWNFGPHDEPLPTPSLCSHGGSELEFSMQPMPGYVASQPATPSFPPSIGPTYGGFFGGGNMANAEYTFPDSYAPETSARSSPGGPPPKSRQFQFAQNVTPQDFNTDK